MSLESLRGNAAVVRGNPQGYRVGWIAPLPAGVEKVDA
jgi:hypothetical protein